MKKTPRPADRQSILIALAVVLALGWSMKSGDMLSALPSLFPYSRSVAATLSDIALMFLLVGLASRQRFTNLLGISGVTESPLRPLIWAAMLFAPAAVAALLVAPVSTDFTGPDLLWKGIAAPFLEELFYRGLAVGALMRLAGWRLLPAVLVPATFFGAVHAYQGVSLEEIAGAVAITAAGGLLFGWLFWRWRWNLWPAVLLHIGLNMIWMVFALGETAVGGWLGNGLRAAVVLGAVALTLRMVPKPAKTA